MLVFCMEVNYLFIHYHTIGAFGETSDDKTIDKQGDDKLLAALKR